MTSADATRRGKSGSRAKTLDIPRLEESYKTLLPRLKAIEEEVSYILGDTISDSGIRIHLIESGVKEFSSIIGKANSKSLDNPLRTLNDLVGARVICLFKSDIKSIDKIINDNFTVISVDDKITGEVDSIGYMSIHYICSMKPEYEGPRYKKIRDIKFEIQLRTICMHAWAVVSHYLDYKGEWDVPAELKKSLTALSGLFYVADSEFEKISDIRITARSEIAAEVSNHSVKESEVNFDTVYSVIATRYDRPAGESDSISELVQQLHEAGIRDVKTWIEYLDKGDPKMFAEDAERETPFVGVGCARVSTGKALPQFDQIVRRKR